jgi:hypothetical protein
MSRLTFNFVSPLIERHFENASDTQFSRKHDALVVCDALKKWNEVVGNEYLLDDFYTSLFRIINSRYGARLLLYLPFDVMKHIPNHFKEDYLDAWYGLLRVQDVRENFHLGDTFEESARPSGEMDRVIKCVHLLPWMMVCGLISCDEISSVISGHKNSLVFLQSYYDVLSVLKIWVKMVVDESEMENALKKISMPGVFIPKARTAPLFNSEKRLAWLAEMQREDFEMVTPNAHLEGPFWPNVAKFLPDLYKCAERLDDNKILMIGGSKIKGYGTVDSDVDVWDFQDFIDENAWGKKALEEASDSSALDGTLSPNDTHVFFNSVWISKRPREEMLTLADDIFRAYSVNCPELVRRYALERLEGDLLQYRLLHKGFARFSGRRSYKVLAQGMDGDCPFYDDEYRKVATMIYAKYIWF